MTGFGYNRALPLARRRIADVRRPPAAPVAGCADPGGRFEGIGIPEVR